MKFTKAEDNWIIEHKGNSLSLPIKSNTLDEVREKALKWKDSNYKEF